MDGFDLDVNNRWEPVSLVADQVEPQLLLVVRLAFSQSRAFNVDLISHRGVRTLICMEETSLVDWPVICFGSAELRVNTAAGHGSSIAASPGGVHLVEPLTLRLAQPVV